MSNLQLTIYKNSTFRLAKTLLIKIQAVIDRMNQDLDLSSAITGYSVDYANPLTWKYYLNISGQYHPTDTLMQVVSLDTAETINFDRTTILQHRNTLKEYLYGSDYYFNLVAEYPEQELLIRGILDPVDINKAIAAANYTILKYDSREVESNETNLISGIQYWIQGFFSRWWIKDYQLIDELYLASTLGALYAQLPNAIHTQRIKNCKTYKVHSFHLWNYLDSYGRFSQHKEYLTLTQALWLYRNINWVRHNAGKKETFDALMEVMLTKRGLPLSTYLLRHNTADMPAELLPNIDALKVNLNLKGIVSDEVSVSTINYLMNKEISLARDNDEVLDEDMQSIIQLVQNGQLSQLPIKIYESDIIDQSERLPFLLSDILLNHWLYLSTSNRYTSLLTIRNPASAEVMAMTPKEAFTVWLYAFNKTKGVLFDAIPDLQAIDVRRIPVPQFAVIRNIYPTTVITDSDIFTLLNLQAVVGTVGNSEDFYSMCVDIHANMLAQREYYTSTNHHVNRGYLEGICNLFYFDPRCKLTPTEKTFDAFFAEKGWDIAELEMSDLSILMGDILTKATGMDVRNDKSVADIQRAMLNIMAQLGTYDTHYIQTVNSEPAIVLDSIAVRLGDVGSNIQSLDRAVVSIDHVKMKAKDKVKSVLDWSSVRVMETNQAKGHYEYFDLSEIVYVSQFEERRFQNTLSDISIVLSGDNDMDAIMSDPNFIQHLTDEIYLHSSAP